jgi:hypothetical protein
MKFSSLAILVLIDSVLVFADDINSYQVPTPPTDTWIIEALVINRNQTIGSSQANFVRPFSLSFNFYHAKYGPCESMGLRQYPRRENEQCVDWDYSKYTAFCPTVRYENNAELPTRNPLEGFWQSCDGRHWSASPCGNNTDEITLMSNPRCQPYTQYVEAKEERPWVKWRVVELDESPSRNTKTADAYSKPFETITIEIVSGQT